MHTLPGLRRAALALFVIGVVVGCDTTSVGPADAGPDASTLDAGTRADASVSPDASVLGDAGPITDAAVDHGPECELTDATSTETDAGLMVSHRNGQSFITWRDRAEGEAGADFRYRVYRSSEPLTSLESLEDAELIAILLNHSGQLFGTAFRPEQRLDTERAMSVLEDDAEPLSTWSGLAAATMRTNGCAYYAVLATDVDGVAAELIEAGVNATTAPVAERVGLRLPIKVYDSATRGIYSPQTEITGTAGLPLMVRLHASNAQGGGAGDYGDYYLYFGDQSMGHQDGLPGVFSVQETHSGPHNLIMRNRDTVVNPSGAGGIETRWFGYVTEPLYGGDRFAYPFTENRLMWMIPWVTERYDVDLERVYAQGGSMGAWGTVTFAYRRPEIFAAVYPDRPRFRQRSMTGVGARGFEDDRLPSGQPWAEHHDSIRWVGEHPEDLPFIGWGIGRRDGFATWQEQVDMVAALIAGRHGFAVSWNDGDHSTGQRAMSEINDQYPPSLFARNESYPAFSNSSIDDDMGTGDPTEGDLMGGINLGFQWMVISDSAALWSVELSNDLATSEMTVDVTPRRRQAFRAAPEDTIEYEISRGETVVASGSVTVDRDGIVTITGVSLLPGEASVLTIRHPS